MKKLFILLLTFAVVCGCGKVELSENEGNNNTTIPDEPNLNPEDDIFLQFCIENFDLDGDGAISQYEADKVTSINCADMEIVRLTDIDKFSNLSTLDCSGNKLVALDLSKNRHLTSVNCKRNSTLRSLSVSSCKELLTLDCTRCLLYSLSAKDCIGLQTLNCSYNSLSSLDLSSATSLQSVDCSNNSLSTLNVGGCSALRTLDCSYNKLKTLDLSKTAGIVTVNCKRNSLTSLVLTGCTELVSLDCSYNSLSSLDVSDSLQLSALDCSDNDSLKEVWMQYNQTISNLSKGNKTILFHYHNIGSTYKDGKDGIVFYITDSGRHGKIVSLDETGCKWSTEYIITGATDENDGMANMKTIQKISGWREKYPAFAWCADKGDGWYLPAIKELEAIYNLGILNINDWRWYWSSTEYNQHVAWGMDMTYDDGTGYKDKIYDYYVCAVSAF